MSASIRLSDLPASAFAAVDQFAEEHQPEARKPRDPVQLATNLLRQLAESPLVLASVRTQARQYFREIERARVQAATAVLAGDDGEGED